jgi:hypothetical protein
LIGTGFERDAGVASEMEPNMARVLYTLDQATESLQLIAPIVRDLQRLQHEGQALLRRKQQLEANSDADPYVLNSILEELAWAEDDALRIHQEIEDLGVEIKDIPRGRVDFYTNYHGRMVYLAWQLGETSVAKWRELNHPFSLRVDIDSLEKSQFLNTIDKVNSEEPIAPNSNRRRK